MLAGPLTGSFFAELGAEVVKIENKKSGGDPTRQWKLSSENAASPYCAYYASANFGKKELFLDLTSDSDYHYLKSLLADADVVISNFQKKTAEKLRVNAEVITEMFPSIIYAQLSAYEYDDPRPGYDLVMQAESGYISMTGTPDGKLCKMPVAMIDILASHQMKEAVLIGLLKRNKTGRGSTIHVSLYKSAITGLINQASNYLMCGKVAAPLGTLHPNISPYGDVFFSKDRQAFMLAVGSDAQFKKLWETLNFSDENYNIFETNKIRVENRSQLHKILEEKFNTLEFQWIKNQLMENNIPFCLIRNISEVFEDPLSTDMVIHEQKNDKVCFSSVSSVAFQLNETTV